MGFSTLGQKNLMGAKVAGITVGLLSALVASPSLAFTIGGAADVIKYQSNGTNTIRCDACAVDPLLVGNASNPGGNVELFASSETVGFTSTPTTLEGTLNGTSIILSSLTAADWNGDFGFNASDWFNALLSQALTPIGTTLLGSSNPFQLFAATSIRERFSDPNISYINQDASGMVSIGLAGHFDVAGILRQALATSLQRNSTLLGALRAGLGLRSGTATQVATRLLNPSVQASEIVKVTYGNQVPQYLYSFTATPSGLVEIRDGVSHSGNYEVSFQGQLPPTTSVPEPASVLSLLAVGAGTAILGRRKTA